MKKSEIEKQAVVKLINSWTVADVLLRLRQPRVKLLTMERSKVTQLEQQIAGGKKPSVKDRITLLNLLLKYRKDLFVFTHGNSEGAGTNPMA